jgi:GPH family glycoside/pentoside/hexuronide:cation symporter
MASSAVKLRLTEKIGYGVGDCAANFIFQTQIVFLMNFYTDVAGITASAVGTMFLISRMWDAVNDPIMGALADRTNTRWGRYRPWVLWTAVPLAVLFVLLFTIPTASPLGILAWAYVTYNLLMMLYTANNIPYSALSGVLTSDPVERTSLAAWRFVFAMVAALVVNTFSLDLIKYFGRGNTAAGYQLTLSLWAVIAVVLFGIAFLSTRERVQPAPQQRSSFRQDLVDLLHNGPWLALFCLSILIYFNLSMRSSITLYYFQYYLNREDLFGWFNGVGLATTIVGIWLSKPLVARYGQRATFRVCLGLTAVFTAMFQFVTPDGILALWLTQIGLQLSFGPTIPILWAMMASVADFSEWKTGRRATAMTFAATVFGFKVGLSLGGLATGWLLDHFGYVPHAVQSADALRGIVLMLGLVPAGVYAMGLAVLSFFSIDRRIELEIQRTLSDRNASA